MANQFLVEIHDHITRLIETSVKEAADAQSRGDDTRSVFIDGKIKELKNIRLYLSEHFDLNTQTYY